MIHAAYVWLVAHPASALELLAALTLLVRAIYAALARVLAPYPRVRAAVEALAAVSPDLWRALVMIARAIAPGSSASRIGRPTTTRSAPARRAAPGLAMRF